MENLRAFAKLYGYVRYFHPSDAASAIDWERFAVYGTRQVSQAGNPAELEATLRRLFGPVAPTVQLYATGQAPPPPPALLTPRDTAGLRLVAWQHRGIGMGNPGPYRSVRLGRRAPERAEGPGFGSVGQRVEAAPYQGQQVKLRAAVRADVEGSGNQAQLWLRVDREGEQRGFFSNMGDRPVTSPSWKTYEITGRVAEDATRIVFGGFLHGSGKAWLDDFELLAREDSSAEWAPVPLENASFQEGDAGAAPPAWGSGTPGYDISTAGGGNAHDGDGRALRIASPGAGTTPGMAKPLFEKRPAAGEVVAKPLGRGLSAQIPLALYSRRDSTRSDSSAGQTLRPEGAPSLKRLQAELEEVPLDSLTAADAGLRYGDVTIAWNVFQHFYPYFDVVDADWDAVLTRTLRRAAADETPAAFLQTLRRMVAQLSDGHGRVGHPLAGKQARLPFKMDQVEGKVVVTAVADSSAASGEACVRRGDVVATLDGTPAAEALRASKPAISGSPQWVTARALGQFGRGESGASVRLELERDGETRACRVQRVALSSRLREERPGPVEEIWEGVYYVNLSQAKMSAIQEKMDTLAAAEGIVFDMRGYPEGGNQAVLQHLTTDTLRSARWQVPQQIYPDQERRVGYDTTGRWTLPPKEPHFTGEAVFLTGPGAISYAESIMGIVEHYELGEIVGQPTAGANGNVNPFTLPGGYRITFTGMRVVKHDRSQHHIIGIEPTVRVERTLEGVRAGRDEVLERAIELVEDAPGE